jgi:hypothetical protein
VNRYAHFTPMTDTVELAACHRGAPMHDVPTAQLWLMDLRPAVEATAPRRFGRLDRALAAAACVSVAAIGGMVGVLSSLGVL